MVVCGRSTVCFVFTLPPPAETSPLSLHDALPIFQDSATLRARRATGSDAFRTGPVLRLAEQQYGARAECVGTRGPDRKSTRLNSSHSSISYAVFCLKKKKKKRDERPPETTKSRS